MKRLLRFGLWVVVALILVVVLAALVGSSFLHFRYGKRQDENIAWLKSHRLGEAPVAGSPTFDLPQDLLAKKLVLLTEIHGTAAPQGIDLAMLRGMNARAGVRDYLAEIDPVQAAMFNRYLVSGDEAPLRRVFDFWTPDAQWGNREFEDKVRAIRALNATLPEARQVSFTGIDQVQDYPLAVQWIAEQCSCKAPSGTGEEAEAANQAKSTLTFLDQIKVKDAETAAALRQSLQQSAMGRGRERTIFENYSWQVQQGTLRDRPAYGMWGFTHGLQDKIGKGYAFAGLVKRSSLPAARSLATIACVPTNAKMMMPAIAIPKPLRPRDGSNPDVSYSVDGPLAYMAGVADLKAAASGPATTTLFRLDGPGSPYERSMGLGPNYSPLGTVPMDKPGGVTTDYVQYVVYSDSAHAVTMRRKGE